MNLFTLKFIFIHINAFVFIDCCFLFLCTYELIYALTHLFIDLCTHICIYDFIYALFLYLVIYSKYILRIHII